MKILKFGGTSISSHAGLQRLAAIAAERKRSSSAIVLVVSALADATDELVRMSHLASAGNPDYAPLLAAFEKQHRDLLEHAHGNSGARAGLDKLLGALSETLRGATAARAMTPRLLDSIMSYGEQLSAHIVCEYLSPQIPGCRLVDARTIIRTDSSFGSARVDTGATERLIGEYFGGFSGVAIVTGFIAADGQGETTTLGRGGSDYTAALLATALGAAEIEFWTSVDGIMTADPKKVRRALTVPALSYDEALELGHFGTELIFAPALQPASDKRIPIRVRNTFKPEHPGSVIGDEPPGGDFLITAISSISNISLFQLQGSGLIGISGTAKRLFGALAAEEINVILISQASSEHSICYAVSPADAPRSAAAVRAAFRDEIENRLVELLPPEEEHSIIAAVGANMRRRRGVAGRLFQALGKNGINVAAIAQGSSELNISAVVARSDESKALNALHDAFFLSGQKTINLFLAGLGQVGSVLLRQLGAHAESAAKSGLELRIAGLMNSRKMLFSEGGLAPAEVAVKLERAGDRANVVGFVERMRELNLPNSIFVDCSASEAVAATYAPILSASISIVTPNKRANSGPLERYRELKEHAQRGNVKFFYETTVGAGLPIIGTLNDLVASGDEIIRIEAVLSGTLSYIFNTFREGIAFSAVVKDAQAKGYTEPDPRDDLSGKDVARKLLILAREIGIPAEEGAVAVESLADRSDADLEALRSSAAAKGEVLRYIARIEGGRAGVALVPVGPQHPFYSLSGSDNIVSFTTKRYFDRPLVVKGPGAGTDVTAAGVLADILRVASYLV